MYRLSLLFGLACAALAAAEDKPTLGKIEKLDPALDALLADGATIELLAEKKFEWSEGPVWDKANKRLLFSDIPRNMIWEWSPAGGLKEFLKPSGYTGTARSMLKEPGSNGLTFNKAGELVMCQHGDRRVSKWVGGKFVTLADKFEGKRLNSPNDLAIKSNGDIYFTDPPYGLMIPGTDNFPGKELQFQGVYRLTEKGELTVLTKDMSRPNGIAFSPDEKTLYVANSDPDKSVWMSYPVKADGTLGDGKVFFDTTDAVKAKKPGLPDGLKVSQDGTIWATGPGGVYVFTQAGKHLGTLATGVPTANVGFGEDGTVLYITADKNLCRIKTKVKGSGVVIVVGTDLQVCPSSGQTWRSVPTESSMTPTRRDFVRATLALPFLPTLAQSQGPVFPGMIVRATEPRNLEFPVSELRDAITPNEHFFVRSHFAVPPIDAKAWRLKVEGAVSTPLDLGYEEVLKLPTTKLTATIECAGNGRVALTPPVSGLQWGQGAVGNAEWTGVSLAALLEKAGVKDAAVEVVLEGSDKGQINSDPKSPGPISFARSLPLDKARKPDVVLAHTMNGEPLPKSHGHPLRAVVGGWYGMASVKWLTRIVVTDKPFQGFFQSLDYSYFVRRDGQPTLIPVTAMQPKAILSRPGLNEIVAAGKPYRLFGAAWAGESAVAKVDVSVDGGKSWTGAKLLGEAKPLQWVLWEHIWEAPARGPASLLVRATDTAGNTQPAVRDPDRRTYMINHLVPVDVTVK